ncbi:tetrahydromethanopterin S-methyltransferase subunit F [Methanolapillus ohkumae]|uniref:Tetrahydromethanopterin S-methyltransferase F subunit domain-containing protein n=1 Tax=Methanolapillus ohkumae TaxID=3028298 RepID=A0AA96V8T7_9EURY|nr:hypothetical protein MsAm2_15410 [Methanosarcinaceae archaeon Am2]
MAGKKQNMDSLSIDRMVESIQRRSQLTSRSLKLDSGIESTRWRGFSVGFLFSFMFAFVIPILILVLLGVL